MQLLTPRLITKTGEKGDIKCFRCKGIHHIKDCPKQAKNKDREADRDADSIIVESATKKVNAALPAWRYVEPNDLTVPIVDANDEKWKFCTKCVCRQSGKKGLYLLSHFDLEHQDDFSPPAPANESNLAAVDVPLGIPAATTRDPTSVSSDDSDDPFEFQGAWCASVSNSAAASAFLVSTVVTDTVSDNDDDDEIATSDDDLPPLIMRLPDLNDDDTDPDAVNLACRFPYLPLKKSSLGLQRKPKGSVLLQGSTLLTITSRSFLTYQWLLFLWKVVCHRFQTCSLQSQLGCSRLQLCPSSRSSMFPGLLIGFSFRVECRFFDFLLDSVGTLLVLRSLASMLLHFGRSF